MILIDYAHFGCHIDDRNRPRVLFNMTPRLLAPLSSILPESSIYLHREEAFSHEREYESVYMVFLHK